MKSVLKSIFGLYVLALAISPATAATPGPVVVGSVNPVTNQVTIFEDLLVKTFQDGTPIQHFHGRFDEALKQYLMVRSGRSEMGKCQTEAFRLLRVSGNRLAIALDGITDIPWNGLGQIRPFRDCFSSTCSGWCRLLGDASTPYDLTDTYCECRNASGECETGLGALQDRNDIQEFGGLEG
jgi:hypothetical protein